MSAATAEDEYEELYAQAVGLLAAILHTTGPVRVPVSLLLKGRGTVTRVDEGSHFVFTGRVV